MLRPFTFKVFIDLLGLHLAYYLFSVCSFCFSFFCSFVLVFLWVAHNFLEFHFDLIIIIIFSVSLCVGFLVITVLGDSVAGQPLGGGKKLLGLGLCSHWVKARERGASLLLLWVGQAPC